MCRPAVVRRSRSRCQKVCVAAAFVAYSRPRLRSPPAMTLHRCMHKWLRACTSQLQEHECCSLLHSGCAPGPRAVAAARRQLPTALPASMLTVPAAPARVDSPATCMRVWGLQARRAPAAARMSRSWVRSSSSGDFPLFSEAGEPPRRAARSVCRGSPSQAPGFSSSSAFSSVPAPL